eukprot:TRINITY_DN2473_c0_g1_i2.p1 TRINITY_DN2473_c0_g1~~TRINITY_DN2473_c0_g1_i2.p1  ORF type:complete len:251 (+),score=52.87 TRINITY_DN2473_c0_g1_i2:262-1014(+)
MIFARENTIHYTPDDHFEETIEVLNPRFVNPQDEAIDHPVIVEIENESTISGIRRMRDLGFDNIGVLSFASAKNPGGGFRTGAQAQEESLARASSLFQCLNGAPGYGINKRNKGFQGFYTDHISYCPKVPVFRDEEGALVDQDDVVYVSFVSSAAPNKKSIRKNKARELYDTLRRRIDRILALFALNGNRVLILGAYGCGVFGNDPEDIAQIFREYIIGKYLGYFDHIVFSILSSKGNNIIEFQDIFIPQ